MPDVFPSVARDIMTHIVLVSQTWAHSATPLVAGDSAFTGGVVAVGDDVLAKSVFVRMTGGPPPQTVMGPRTNQDILENTLQVRVRGDRNEPQDTEDFAFAVWTELRKSKPLRDGGPATYMRVMMDQAAPIDMGPDENGNGEFAINIIVWEQN